MTTEETIDRLQKSVRRQRLGLIGVGLGLAAAIFLGMAEQAPNHLSLDGLTITKDGKPRIVMGTDEDDGGVGLAFLDTHGVARIAIGTGEKSDCGLMILDKNEAPRVVMGDGPDGTGVMLIGAGLIEVPMPPGSGTKN